MLTKRGVSVYLFLAITQMVISTLMAEGEGGYSEDKSSDGQVSEKSAVPESNSSTFVPVSVKLSFGDVSEVLCPFNKDSLYVTKKECVVRGCFWARIEGSAPASSPRCFFPSAAIHGYWIETEEDLPDGRVQLGLKLIKTSLQIVPDLKERLEVSFTPYGEDMFRIKITDPVESRYEVPVPLNIPQSPTTSTKYDVSFRMIAENDKNSDVFVIQVRRRDNGNVLFDTSVGGFTFADQFLQVSTRLASANLYGLGEKSNYRFRHDLNFKTWPLFARDEGPKDGEYNLYGSHPVYYVLEENGQSYAVFWLNSNAMEAETLPSPGLTLRSIGGVIDLFFFLGPSPSQVVSQYTTLIGRPFLPPYWALGFQLCRYGHPNIQDMEAVILRTRRYAIPQDVQYADIDYMEDRKDFTVDEERFSGLGSLVKRSKNDGLRFIVILDPAINVEVGPKYETHQRAIQKDVYIKWFNETLTPEKNYGLGTVMLGYVWPDNRTAFPDWFKSQTRDWWAKEIRLFYNTVQFDGLWIDMNEPANFGTNLASPWNWPSERLPWSLHCPHSIWDDPPYPTKASRMGNPDDQGSNRLSDKTICMVGLQGEKDQYLHYDVHNLYGWSQTLPTLQALQMVTGKRSIVVSRSTYPTSGRWAGHWLGDNTARWEDLKASITGMLEFNLFGIPFVGADICGFYGNSREDLCRRWMQLGAFYPYARNHNSKGYNNDQDPGRWPSVAESGREALRLRYSLLPFLYTLHFLASSEGETVIRPLFFEFPKDPSTWPIDDQFLWGSSLMIAPILTEQTSWRSVYFPEGNWFEHPKGTLLAFESGTLVNISLPEAELVPLYVRGGSILPTQRPAANTKLSRKKPLGLVVAPDAKDHAEGVLFWDDGESIETIENMEYYKAKFTYYDGVVKWMVKNVNKKLTKDLTMSDLRAYDVTQRPRAILKDGERITNADWYYDPSLKVLQVYNLNLAIDKNFTLSWTEDYDYKLPCPLPYKNGWTEHNPTTKELCLPACIWNASNIQNLCHLPSNLEMGYKIVGEKTLTEKGFEILLTKRNLDSLFGDDITELKLEVFFYSNSLLRFKFTDAAAERYEVPLSLTLPEENATTTLYEVNLEGEEVGDPFALYIVRKDTGAALFDTRIGGFVFSNQFLSMSTFLPSRNVYGFGENNHPTFRHSLEGKVWPLFARDEPPQNWNHRTLNLYGSHPFYQVQENDGYSHGLFLLNSNAIDYQLLDFPALTLRTIGGVLDFFLFAGPTPEDVNKQYTGLIHRPVLPPYWALGFQLSRYGYRDTLHIEEVVNRTKFYGIPQDVQYVDIDYMDRRKDFTIDPNHFGDLPELFDRLRKDGMKTIVNLDTSINAEMDWNEYETHYRALKSDAYIRWPPVALQEAQKYNKPENDLVLGYVWQDNRTAFPNWHKESTKNWWHDEILLFHNKSLKFDGLWLDMNEPTVFGTNLDQPWNWPGERPPWNLKCPPNKWDDLPYTPKAASLGPSFRLSDKTLCMIAEETPYRHYDSHNLYGWSQSGPTLKALRQATGKRGLIISRSTFPGSGQWAGHWLGNNAATWEDLRRSIVGMLEFNLFGIPYVGADICGFSGESEEELCQRWMQLGAFYPHARNHNGIGFKDQDPGMWPSVAESSRKVLNTRYRLLPYFYTLFYEASVYGGTVIRPLHHEFSTDRNTYDIDTQFLWGPALMVSPVLAKGHLSRLVYFPLDFWYDFYTGKPVEWAGEEIRVEADLETIPLHIRGGFVIPLQQPANNTQFSRRNPFHLLVTLNGSRQAYGVLFWDDGEGVDTAARGLYDFLTFAFDQDMLQIDISRNVDLMTSLSLSNVTLYGIENKPSYVHLNGIQLNQTEIFYDYSHLKLILALNVSLNQNITLSFDNLWL